jgi:homocitrate synthase NifV
MGRLEMLIDTTLREGAQMYGVYMPASLRQEILVSLLRAGVEEMEVGWVGQEGVDTLLRHGQRGGPGLLSRMTVWSPLRSVDLRKTAAMGAKRIHFGVPVSDGHLTKRLGIDRTELQNRVGQIVSEAVDLGFSYISVGLEDVSRADLAFALQVARMVERHGGHRVRLSDTIGLLTPLETAWLVERFCRESGLAVGFHGHNDFGMATANALTALEAGASHVDVSLLGLGERAGIAALEEVSLVLNSRGKASYDHGEIVLLARNVATAANIPIARNRALLGEDLFACESGLHLHAMAVDPALFEPFPPETVRGRRIWETGLKSGRAAISDAAQRLGLELSEGEVEGLTVLVRDRSRILSRPLREGELLQLASTVS